MPPKKNKAQETTVQGEGEEKREKMKDEKQNEDSLKVDGEPKKKRAPSQIKDKGNKNENKNKNKKPTDDQAEAKPKPKPRTKVVKVNKDAPPYPPPTSQEYNVVTKSIPPSLPPSQTSKFDRFSRDSINNALTFHINDVDLGIVNALRRVITSEIPNVGIEFDPYDDEKSDIHFIENSSSLHNEFLGHRISMIPVKLDEDEIENFEKSKYNFEIKKHNTTKDKLSVTTDDIMIVDEYGEDKGQAFHEKVFPRSSITGDPILIVVLNENNYNPEYGEKLHVKFRCSIDIAQKHSRYSPVCTCVYHNVVDESKADKAREMYVKTRQSERVNALSIKNIKRGESMQNIVNEGDVSINDDSLEDMEKLRARFNVHDIYRHYKTNEFDEPSSFAFIIEPESRLSERYLVKKGLEVLILKLQKIVEEKRFKVSSLGNNAFTILIKGEQHTIGNLLQVLFYNIFVRREEKRKLGYVGYYLVHPLVEEIVLKMKFNGPLSDIEDCSEFFKMGVKQMEIMLDELKNEWERIEAI